MPGQDDLWAWLQQYGGDWLSAPYGGHSTNYGPPPGNPGGPGSVGNDAGFNNPYQAAAGASAAPPQINAAMVPGTGPPDVMSQSAMYPPQYGGPTAAADAARGPQPVMARTYPHMPWPGSPAPQTYPHMPWPDTGAPPGSPSATPKPAGGPKGPLASSSAPAAPMKRTPGAPNLGYYQNPRFGVTSYQVPNSTRNAPLITTLNLGGLFGGGGQQPAPAAANPANVPAPNAQPTSATAPDVYPAAATAPNIYPGNDWNWNAGPRPETANEAVARRFRGGGGSGYGGMPPNAWG